MIRYEQEYVSTYGSQVRVTIYDLEYSGDPMGMSLVQGSLSVARIGEHLLDQITTMKAKLSVPIDEAEKATFLEDLLGFEEGRFFLKVEKQDHDIFIGKIVMNEIAIDDKINPTISLTAIDGVTDLKNIDYEHPNAGLASISQILGKILGNLQIWDIHAPASNFGIASDLRPNQGFEWHEVWENVRLFDYFYTRDNNDVIKPMNCYDVMVEVCKRLFLKLVWENGRFQFLGGEGYHNDRGPWIMYDLDGLGVQSMDINYPVVDILPKAYADGLFTASAGYKKVTIKTKKEFTAKKNDPEDSKEVFTTGATYSPYGTLIAGKTYQLGFVYAVYYVDKGESIVQYPDAFSITATIRETNLTNGTVTVIGTRVVFYPYNNGTYTAFFDVPVAAYDRLVEVQFVLDKRSSPFGTDGDFTVRIRAKVQFWSNYEEYGDVTFTSSLPSSRNVLSKELEIKGPDEYGSELSKFYFWSGSVFETRTPSNDQWRFVSTDSYDGLERSLSAYYLKILRNNEIYLDIGVENPDPGASGDFGLFTSIARYDFRGLEYAIISYEMNVMLDIIQLRMYKLQDIDATGIVTVADAPGLNPNEYNTSNFTGAAKKVALPYYRDWENFTGSVITFSDYMFPRSNDYPVKLMRRSILLFINGVKQKIRVEAPALRKEVYIDQSNYQAFFFETLNNVYIELYIFDYFEGNTVQF